MPPRVLALSAAHGRVGYVFLVGTELMDWRISDRASESPVAAAGYAQERINTFQPTIVVTEKLSSATRKRDKTKGIITAIAGAAARNAVYDIAVPRQQHYPNKYTEAVALLQRYPELKPWLPKKRRIFDKEPENMVVFEALALARPVIDDPTTTLAAHLG